MLYPGEKIHRYRELVLEIPSNLGIQNTPPKTNCCIVVSNLIFVSEGCPFNQSRPLQNILSIPTGSTFCGHILYSPPHHQKSSDSKPYYLTLNRDTSNAVVLVYCTQTAIVCVRVQYDKGSDLSPNGVDTRDVHMRLDFFFFKVKM